MVLGAISCPKRYVSYINETIKGLKTKNNFHIHSEAKWTKVCKKHLQLYIDLVNMFFDNQNLAFRCLIIPNKKALNHVKYNQTHDDWYYKMYFNMLKQMFSTNDLYNVYIDIKDTHSTEKAKKLNDVCCNNIYDFSHSIIKKIQPIRSNEVEIMQLVDILIGGVCYYNRFNDLKHITSPSKMTVIDVIRRRSGYMLTRSTLLKEPRFNIFVWKPDFYWED